MDKLKTIGERIKTARQDLRLKTEELAAKVGCSDEYLEWVEEGQAEPPVALLIQLAKALKLDSGSFLREEDTTRRKEEVTKRTRHYSYTTLTPPDEKNHLAAFAITIPPETAHEGVGYSHEGEEFVFVIQGEVDVTIGDERNRLAEKESLHFNSNISHEISNPGQVEAKCLVVLYVP